jgi:hypothetical protein
MFPSIDPTDTAERESADTVACEAMLTYGSERLLRPHRSEALRVRTVVTRILVPVFQMLEQAHAAEAAC